jgi:hypothetical protein
LWFNWMLGWWTKNTRNGLYQRHDNFGGVTLSIIVAKWWPLQKFDWIVWTESQSWVDYRTHTASENAEQK